jgi:hypothetical protein
MKPETISLIDALDRTNFFSCSGMRDTTEAQILDSWKNAFLSCASEQWTDLLQEMSNQLAENLARTSMERYRNWNHLVLDIDPNVDALLARKAEPILESYNPPAKFTSTMSWVLVHACMEQEYADVVAPAFFSRLAEWYLRGHYPCGWLGDYPDGKVIAY